MDGDFRSALGFDDAFRVAGWTVVPRAHELVRPGETVRIEPKPMEVLVYLAAHAGEAVAREALMEAVWPGVYVTEHALNRCVSQLRKLFDDDPRAPHVIETIPKAGYRLIAPVERLGDGMAAPPEAFDVRVTTAPVAAPPPAAPAPRRRRTGWMLAGLAVAVLLVAPAGAFILRRLPAPATTPLSVEPGVETGAAWSPDGTRLAYVHAAEGVRRLYVRALGADTPVALTEGPSDGAPAWSPDGATLAFVRCDSLACALWAVPSLGGEARRLADGPVRPGGLDWSPDGRTLAVGAPSAAGPPGLALVARDTGVRRTLTAPPAGFADLAPVFSPDGAWVLFQRGNGAGADLWRAPAAGGEAERVTADARPLAGHTWAADGRSVVFSSARTGVYALWRVPAAGGTPEPVMGPAVRDPGGPALARAGRRLAVSDWAFEINLWEHVEGEAPARRIASTLWSKQPHLRPDGARVVFVSNRTGPTEVWTARRDGAGLVRLTDFGGASVEHPRFSPDGRLIVFQARSETHADLYVVRAEGGPPRRLTASPADEVAPRWSRDGRTLYFGSNREGAWQVWRMPAGGGQATRVTTGGGYTAEETSDGALLVARYAEPGLWRVAGGTETRVAYLPALGDWGNWAVVGEGVVALSRENGALRLVRLDLDGGAASPLPFTLRDVMPNEPGFALAADGRAVLAAQVDRVEADLLLVAPFE
jgi:Tol biopolymer transport system component/DNA-binding winged helix-turn-helix (wHTH) protein